MAKRPRRQDEIWTPYETVEKMLELLPWPEAWEEDKTFLDPACGEGAILEQILVERLAHEHDALEALWKCFGVDIMPDNADATRRRLLRAVEDAGDTVTPEHVLAVLVNIVCADALTYDYEFRCERKELEPKLRAWWHDKPWRKSHA